VTRKRDYDYLNALEKINKMKLNKERRLDAIIKEEKRRKNQMDF